jgi:hypothetical protein
MSVGKPWSATINLYTGDYVIPSGVIVQEARTGNASGHVTFRFTNGNNLGWDATSYDIKKFPHGMQRVVQIGTSAALRGSVITLYGLTQA